MEKLVKMVGRFEKMDINEVIETTFDNDPVNTTALNLNRSQMDSGIDAKGRKMRTYKSVYPDVYAQYTIAIKQMTGQPHDRVTLKDTGSFHKKLELKSFPGHAAIIGDTKKSDGDIMDNIDVNEALGLTPENINKLRPTLVNEMTKQIRVNIL